MITFLRVMPEDIELLTFIEQLYISAFPNDERRNFSEVISLLYSAPPFRLMAICDNNIPIGLLAYWQWETFCYIEHLAIDPQRRSNNYGSQAILALIAERNMPIILEVERPEDEMSKRRIAFYERLGFKLWSHIDYIQPPYDATKESMALYLMTQGEMDLDKIYPEVKAVIYGEVYGVASR